jgi:predicted amidohydrolase
MKTAFLQTNLVWENPIANRLNLESEILSCAKKFDIMVLPEMFTSGFSMFPEKLAENMQGETVQWMVLLAKKTKSAICGSIIIEENKHFYNRFLFVHPKGQIDFYDKKHLFALAGENEKYTKGLEKKIISYKKWNICLQICYDLRFPVFSRNQEGYDLLIYVANWPKPRINAWNTLLKARAIENMCYVVGVNRTGLDGNNNEYTGSSQVIDELGNELVHAETKEGIFVVKIDKNKMLATRNKLPFLDDKDRFTIH